MDKEKRTVKVRFSSETAVSRWFGDEVLSHDSSNVRMDRIRNGAAVLLEHDTGMGIGITEGGEITSSRTGEATVRFARNSRADEALAEVEDGTLRWISVGYRVHEFAVDEPESGNPTYRAVDWEPFEISFVRIPADATAQVLRNGNTSTENLVKVTMKRNILLDKEGTGGGGTATTTETKPDNSAAILESRNTEKNRTKAIMSSAARFRDRVPKAMEQSQAAIDSDWSAEKFDRWLLDALAECQNEVKEEIEHDARPKTQTRSYGQQIVEHPDFVRTLEAFRARGKKAKTRCDLSFEVEGDFLSQRATLTTTVSGLTKYERPPGVVMVEQQPLMVANLFAQGTTQNTTIRYLREDTFTNASTALAEEGTFQEMSWDLSEQDTAIKKCGVLGRITDEMLADSDAIASYFDARIPFAVAQLQDQHLVSGDGTSNKITGILSTSGIQTEAAGASPTQIDAFCKAKTKVGNGVGFFPADAILINPTDWQNIRLTKDSNGQYLLGGPAFGPYGVGSYMASGMLWGLPVVETTAISAGTAIVGAFRLGAQLWTRQGLLVEMTNSDASDFANGRVAVRAYLRHGLSVYRPLAFCTVTGL